MIVAQAILFFVPGNTYGKYVRLLVGVMLILRLIEPLFGFVIKEEKQQEIRERIWELEQAVHAQSGELVLEEAADLVSKGIGEELKGRLEECDDVHRIESVDFDREKENIIITISEKGRGEDGDKIRIEPVKLGEAGDRDDAAKEDPEKEQLKALYGSCLGVEAGRIEIIWDR